MRTYRGARIDGIPTVVVVDDNPRTTREQPLDPCNHIRNHSPTGFNWGYGGSGPAQLALALLFNATHDQETSERLYQQFKREVIGRLANDQWETTQEEVLAWVACHPTVALD